MKDQLNTEVAFPHGKLEPVFDNIWFVQGGWDMPVPLKPRISRSMTIIRNPTNGELTLVNSMRLSEAGLKALDKLGEVKHVIRLASLHGADDGFYKDRYKARIYALKGTYYARGLNSDATTADNYFTADEYFDEHTQLPISDAKVYVLKSPKLREASLLLKRESGILLSGDFFHNNPKPDEFFNRLGKALMHLFRLAKPYNVGVGWFLQMKPKRAEFLSILDIPFEHVLPIHGLPVIGEAKQHYRQVVEKYAAKAAV